MGISQIGINCFNIAQIDSILYQFTYMGMELWYGYVHIYDNNDNYNKNDSNDNDKNDDNNNDDNNNLSLF